MSANLRIEAPRGPFDNRIFRETIDCTFMTNEEATIAASMQSCGMAP